MDLGEAFALGLGIGSVMGWIVAWVQHSAHVKALEKELHWAKARVSVMELDLEKARVRDRLWAKATVQRLQSKSQKVKD